MANLEVISPDTVPGSVCYVFIGPTIVSIFFEIMVHFQLLRSKTNKFVAQPPLTIPEQSRMVRSPACLGKKQK